MREGQTGEKDLDHVIVRPYPKVVLLYPIALCALVCGAIQSFASEASPERDRVLGLVFFTVFGLNLLVFSFEFDARASEGLAPTLTRYDEFGDPVYEATGAAPLPSAGAIWYSGTVRFRRFEAFHEFVNADTIAQGLAAFAPDGVAFEAGSIMLARLHQLAARRRDFAFETTLASRSLAPWLADLLGTGYEFHLVFLWLPSADFAVQRVADRVRMGGHHVPEATVRRRYERGLRNFFRLYQPLATSWRMYDNSVMQSARLIAALTRSLAVMTVVHSHCSSSSALRPSRAVAASDVSRLTVSSPCVTLRLGLRYSPLMPGLTLDSAGEAAVCGEVGL